MAVVSVMTTKGGAGKTTATLLLGTGLAAMGTKVCLIDADPNQPLVKWAAEAELPDTLSIIGDVTEENIIETIEEQSAKVSFVLVDLEGSANLSTGYAITSSDLILIPLQGSKLDADEAAKTLKFIMRQAKSTNREIPARVFWSRAPAAYQTRSGRDLGTQFEEAGIAFLTTRVVEREAFKGMVNYAATLETLTSEQVPSLDKARTNAANFIVEVVEILKELRK